MIALAVVSLLSAGVAEMRRRRTRFLRVAEYHERKNPDRWGGFVPPALTAHDRWHIELAKKYRRAARYPWLPVASDSAPPIDLRQAPCDCGLHPHLSYVSEISQALESDGWKIGSGIVSPESGEPYWSVWGSKGSARIGSHGETEEQAWQAAMEEARLKSR
jgi:hypothetical protein